VSYRRSFHSLEQLSADVSLNSDSQKTDGRQQVIIQVSKYLI